MLHLVLAGMLQAAAAPLPLWLMSTAQWRQTAPPARHDLVADYMRAFCGSLRMPVERLEACLDADLMTRSNKEGRMFDVAARCLDRIDDAGKGT